MNKSEQINWYRTFDSFRKSRITQWTPKIYKELITSLKNVLNQDSFQSVISRLDFNFNIDKLATVIQNVYVDAGRVMGGKAYQLVQQDSKRSVKRMTPIGYNEELINDIIAYFRLHLLNEAVFPISETMRAWILKQVIEGQEQGKSLQQVADEIIKHDFPKNRAILITRTEVLKAANYGSLQGAKKAGYKTNKIWISAKDFRTRRIPRDAYSHIAMDGITIGIDEMFQVPKKTGGYDSLMQPGDPSGDAGDVIQCRCTIGFSIVRGSNGLPIRV